MKKIITLTIIAFFTLNLSAQKIEKGIWQIEIGTGIDANYSWITGGDWKTETKFNGSLVSGSDLNGDWDEIYDSQTNLNYDIDFTNFSDWEGRFLDGVSFGYFVADGLLIGLGLDLNGLNTGDNYNDKLGADIGEKAKVKFNEFKLGAIPKIRYYVPTGRGNAMFFEGSYGMGINNSKAFAEGRIVGGSQTGIPDPWDYVGAGIAAAADEKDTWEEKNNIFSSSVGIGLGYSAFLFNSREIFSIEPQIGFNINSRNRKSETTIYDEDLDNTTVLTSEDKISNMGIYMKLKLSFYLGRHFWSH